MNVLDRRFVNTAGELSAQGIGCIVRSVFLQGTLLCDPERLPDRVGHLVGYVREFRSRCDEARVSPLTASLSFVAQTAGVDGVVVGAQTIGELTEIVSSWHEALDRPEVGQYVGDIEVPEDLGIDPRGWR